MTRADPLARLIALLQGHVAPGSLSPREWEHTVRLARASDMSGRLAELLCHHEIEGSLPAGVRRYVIAWRTITQKLEADLALELDELRGTLGHLGFEPILLKGAAYVANREPWAKGRHFSDIDLLVPHEQISEVERALFARGWITTHRDDPYTQRYYREWMHEIPPLTHALRGTTIDLHRAITPKIGRIKSPMDPLLDEAQPVQDQPGFRRLSDIDQLLHCATHIFIDTEIPKGLRDLFDFNAMLERSAANTVTAQAAIVERAEQLGLGRMLYYAWFHAHRLMGAVAPPARVEAFAPVRPVRVLMTGIYTRALPPTHPLCSNVLASASRTAILARGHWLRMPLPMLVRHLAKKLKDAAKTEPPDVKEDAKL